MTRDVLALRIIPFAFGAAGGLLGLPTLGFLDLGLLGLGLGVGVGFFAGAVFVALRYSLRVRDARSREERMHAEAMRQLGSLQAMGPHRLAAPPTRGSAASLGQRVDAALEAGDDARVLEELWRLHREYPKSALVLTRLVHQLHWCEDPRWAELLPAARVAAHQVGAVRLLEELRRFDDLDELAEDRPGEIVAGID